MGNGDLDLASNHAYSITTLMNYGDATFDAGKSFTGGEGRLVAADLNGDGRMDLATPSALLFNGAPDRDRDGVPDECETHFHRGDADGNGRITLSDPVFLLRSFLFAGPAPACRESADADDGGAVNLGDAIFVLRYLFLDGPPPAAPGPPGHPCGPDPGAPGSPGDLGCAAYENC